MLNTGAQSSSPTVSCGELSRLRPSFAPTRTKNQVENRAQPNTGTNDPIHHSSPKIVSRVQERPSEAPGMKMNRLLHPRIGVALSGGGFRASIFHLGVLRRLAEAGVLDEFDVLSGVSGASVVSAFVAQRWAPAPGEFRGRVIQPFSHLVQERDFMKDWLSESLVTVPVRWRVTDTRTNTAARILGRRFFQDASCSSLPESPYLILNSVALGSRRPWRFTRDGMGDARHGYTGWNGQDLPLGVAVVASLALPPLFPPSRINLQPYAFAAATNEERQTVHEDYAALIDGSFYDALGIEALINDGGTQLAQRLLNPPKFLVASDAGALPKNATKKGGVPKTREAFLLYRGNEITRNQLSVLGRRQLTRIFDSAQSRLSGILIHIYDNPIAYSDGSRLYRDVVDPQILIPDGLHRQIVKIRIGFGRLSARECEALLYHGYQLTDAVLWARRKKLPDSCRVPETPAPEWKIQFTKDRIMAWNEALKHSHKAEVFSAG